MVEIFVDKVDEVHAVVWSDDRGVLHELSEFFSFFAKNYQYSPKYKAKVWDGKIRLYSLATGKLYQGLIPYVKAFCKERGIKFTNQIIDIPPPNFDYDTFIKSLGLVHTPYDTQKEAIVTCINDRRKLLLSPVNSGKSLIIYSLSRFFLEEVERKTLIIVPSISLVHQMTQDFKDYNPEWDVDGNVHQIYSGKEKVTDKRIVLTTWQSLQNIKDKKYFLQFDAVIVDEAHGAQAKELVSIMEACKKAYYRIGTTGTLDNIEVNKLTIEGLTGITKQVTTNEELIKNKVSSDIKIQCLILNHPKEACKLNAKNTYQEEIAYVLGLEKRNKIIANLCKLIPEDKNVIVFTQYHEHIKHIQEALEKSGNTKPVFILSGKIDPEIREKTRKLINTLNGVIIIATYGVASTGLNIKNLQYAITSSPSKSQIRVIQTIGRLLRKDGKENYVILFDIVDNLKYFKDRNNYLYEHFLKRLEIYNSEKFPFSIKKINI